MRADAREGDIGMQLGEISKANPEVAIGSYPFFGRQHGPDTNVVLRVPDAQKLARSYSCAESVCIRSLWNIVRCHAPRLSSKRKI